MCREIELGGVLIQELFRIQETFVHEKPLVVRAVLQDVHLLADVIEHLCRVVVTSEPTISHVLPVRRRDEHVVVDSRDLDAHFINAGRVLEIAFQVVRETEVVANVRMRRAPRDSGFVGRAVRARLRRQRPQ